MKRILLHLDHRENQTLLANELGTRHEVATSSADADFDQPFDLCILDGPALDRLWERVQERKAMEQPIFTPILLVTSRPGVKMITRQVWRNVDELIIAPIEKAELRARVEILLRARDLTLDLKERAVEAESSARARDEVLAIVSHDLRNPLNLVLTSGSFLLETADQLTSSQRQQLQLVHRAAEQMNRLIQDLLEVSGIEAGNLTIEPHPEQVEVLLSEACGQLTHAAHAKGVRLVCEAPAGFPRVHADRDRVLQVFSNLVGNAVKFTPPEGEIRLSADLDDASVRFAVTDTGPGIDGKDLPHIFDRFWQAQRSRDGGAGLGLAIARGIVAAHGGELWVESTVGVGSSFLFTLPVRH